MQSTRDNVGSAMRHVVMFCVAALTTACSSGDSTVASSVPADHLSDLAARLQTNVRATSLDGWTCTSDYGAPVVYFFFKRGAVSNTDPLLQLGLQLDPMVPSLGDYQWVVTSEDSVQLQAAEIGVQIDWTALRFTSEKSLTVHSSVRGALHCSLETTQRSSS